MTLILYGVPLSPFVRKAEVVLREKGLEFEHEPVNIMPMPDWFKAISPARRIPVLRDSALGEEGTQGTIADSSAICVYLERLQPEPALYPEEPYRHARAVWYEEYADSELAAAIGMGVFRPLMFPRFQKQEPDLETARKTWQERLPRLFDYLEGELGGALAAGGFLTGEALSIGDVAVACQLTQLELVAGRPDRGRWPALGGFLDRVTARESFAPNLAACRRVVEKVAGGPVDLAAR